MPSPYAVLGAFPGMQFCVSAEGLSAGGPGSESLLISLTFSSCRASVCLSAERNNNRPGGLKSWALLGKYQSSSQRGCRGAFPGSTSQTFFSWASVSPWVWQAWCMVCKSLSCSSQNPPGGPCPGSCLGAGHVQSSSTGPPGLLSAFNSAHNSWDAPWLPGWQSAVASFQPLTWFWGGVWVGSVNPMHIY